MKERPFDNFKTAITDPSYFVGRSQLIEIVRKSPFRVRVLLGGRRIGKTSTLRALEWNLLDPSSDKCRRAFPVFISLQYEQPKDLDNLRYILIARLREAIERWRNIPKTSLNLRAKYREFRRQVASANVTFNFLKTVSARFDIINPDYERRLIGEDFRQALLSTIGELKAWDFEFEGVCFLFDEAEFVVCQDWANDAWSYFRGLKDTDAALSPFFGLVLSGYRDLKEYQQKVGSPLFNIAQVSWLQTLDDEEVRELVSYRCQDEEINLDANVVNTIMQWAGCHPYLTQQMLNTLFDSQPIAQSSIWKNLFNQIIKNNKYHFGVWWNQEGQTDGFGESERLVYRALAENRQGNAENLAEIVNLSYNQTADALEILAGTGVIRQLDEEYYVVGAQLFEKWVKE